MGGHRVCNSVTGPKVEIHIPARVLAPETAIRTVPAQSPTEQELRTFQQRYFNNPGNTGINSAPDRIPGGTPGNTAGPGMGIGSATEPPTY